MKLTVIVEDAPEGWGQSLKGSMQMLAGANLVIVNGKVTKDHNAAPGRRVVVTIEDASEPPIEPGFQGWAGGPEPCA